MVMMQRLRAETSALYAILRQVLSPEHIASSRAAYTSMLRRMYASIWPVESYIESLAHSDFFPLAIPDRDQRFQKRDWLANDLAALDVPNLPAVSAGEELFPDREIESAVGHLYVLERITYDSHWTATELRRRLGITSDAGASFFAGYKTEKDEMWQAFRAWMTSLPLDERHVTTAAQIAFERFICAWR